MKNRFFGFLVIASLSVMSVTIAAPPHDPVEDLTEVFQLTEASDLCLQFTKDYSVFVYDVQHVSKEVKMAYVHNVLDSSRNDFVSFTNYAEQWQVNKQHTGNDKRISNLTYSAFTSTIKDDIERETYSQLRNWRDPGRQTQDIELRHIKIKG
jgi:hypothetical protein